MNPTTTPATIATTADGQSVVMDRATFDALLRVLLTGSERPNVGGWTYCDGTDVAAARARLDAAGLGVSESVARIHAQRRATRAARA